MGNRRRGSGSVLIITLAFLTLMCVLLVAFVGSMRSDVVAARFHLGGVRAGLYAEEAADIALARLRTASPSTSAIWISQPGRIVALNTNGATETVIDLSSGAAAVGASSDVAADLNPKGFSSAGAGYLVAATNSPMPVKWIYLRRDGTRDAASPPPFIPGNPVIGRLAFWTDDASARINVNTAWKRAAANTAAWSHPSKVDLTALFAAQDADALHAGRATRFFNSVDEARPISSASSTVVDSNAFALTAYNHSPELNLFGEPRIVLTTQQSLAGGSTNFFDILKTANTDPGLLANLDTAKTTATVNRLVTLLSRTNWPFLPGKSFKGKFAPVRPEQIALNLVEYVRAAESANAVVEPINGDFSGSGGAFVASSLGNIATETAILGNNRGPRITEIGIWAPSSSATASAASPSWPITFKVEVYLPVNSGLPSIPLTNLYLGLQSGVSWGGVQITAAEAGGTTVLNAGNYCTITRTVSLPSSSSVVPMPRPYQIVIRVRLQSASAGNPWLDAAQLKANGWLNYTFDGPVAAPSADKVTTFQIDDPDLNKFTANWKTQRANTLGAANSGSTLGTASTLSPLAQQDTDAGGNLASGVRWPGVKGSAQNPLGVVQSVGELGGVHTGTEAEAAGVPWRTLRLQPQKAGSGELPDWALLDLFTVPSMVSTNDSPFALPNGQPGGRINVNAALLPFNGSNSTPAFVRTAPLRALLLNASPQNGGAALSLSQVANLANNIASFPALLATGANPGRAYGTNSVFYSPGQLAEVAGIADGGEESEELLREVVGLGTTRGDVFAIYSVGQAVIQDKNGAIRVSAERRYVTTLERTGSATTNAFQTVSFQELNP